MHTHYIKTAACSLGSEKKYKCAFPVIDWQTLYPEGVVSTTLDESRQRRRQEKRERVIHMCQRLRNRVSLVLAHIVTGEAVAPLVIRPAQVTLHGLPVVAAKPSSNCSRGEVTRFSESSRARMLRSVAKLDLTGRSLAFVTLTYDGQSNKQNSDDVRRNFRAFAARLERKSWYGGFLWRWEYQKRGAAHFHLLIWSKQGQAAELTWCNEAWHEILDSSQEAHLLYGCKVDLLAQGDESQVVGYISKYAAKIGDYPDWHRGRVWGIRGEKPYGRVVVAWLPPSLVERVRRVMWEELTSARNYMGAHNVNACPDSYRDACALNDVSTLDVSGASACDADGNPMFSSLSEESKQRVTMHCNFLVGRVVRECLLAFCRLNGFTIAEPGQGVTRQLAIDMQ